MNVLSEVLRVKRRESATQKSLMLTIFRFDPATVRQTSSMVVRHSCLLAGALMRPSTDTERVAAMGKNARAMLEARFARREHSVDGSMLDQVI